MRNNLKLVLFGTIALTALASCEKEKTLQDKVEDSPTYNALTGEVAADFAFSVATNTSKSASTRQSADEVQANVDAASKFRGIDNAYLLSFKLADDGKHLYAAQASDKSYSLPTLLGASTLDPSGTAADKSRRVVELSIPTGTNTFAFYGKAIKTKSADEQGKISYDLNPADLNATSFSLVPRITEYNTELAQTEKLIAGVLTRIMKNGMNVTTAGEKYANTVEKVNYNTVDYTPAVKWSDYATYDSATKKWSIAATSPVAPDPTDATSTPGSLAALEEILGNSFVTLVNINEGEIRAGSGPSIAKMIGDIAVSIGKVANATPTSYPEYVAQVMAYRILTRFANYFNIGSVNTLGRDFRAIITDGDNCDWLDASSVKSNLVAHDSEYTATDFSEVADNMIKKFPTEFEVPMGSAQLLIDAATLTASYSSGDAKFFGNETFNINKVTYPAELCYFGNSSIRVSNQGKTVSDYPDGAGNASDEWLNDASWAADWSVDKHVLSSTRAVAMKNNINYGSALLESTVGYATGVTKLQDNNKGIHPEEDANEFTVAADLFKVTGILVGGQYQTVNWCYVPASGDPEYVVYDRIADPLDASALSSDAIQVPASGNSVANYTILWDNYNSALAINAQQAVYVAVEFVNNTGKDFWGKHNVVRKGGTFYIIGKLDPTASTGVNKTNFAWPTDGYALPPYSTVSGSEGETIKAERVFIQDYKTVANFKLNATSLQNAYVTVPDLRSTQMSLGLSVDLTWRDGIEFESVLGTL